MGRTSRTGAVCCVVALFCAPAFSATLTGVVDGPDGKPFAGAFVAATDAKIKMTVNVLSDAEGRFRLPNLRAATWDVRAFATGYSSPLVTPIVVDETDAKSIDFTLAKTPVKWSDLSTYQGRMLLPKTKAHDLSHRNRFSSPASILVHLFQNKMAKNNFDEAGWRSMVDYMRTTMLPLGTRRMSDDQAGDIASYLTRAFGPNSPKPASPKSMPDYRALVRPVASNATNIVYVEYDFPAPGRHRAVEQGVRQKRHHFNPYFGRGNAVVRLDPASGDMKSFPLSSTLTQAAGVHLAVPSADGSVWFSEVGRGRIGRLDPQTGQMTEFQNSPLEDGRRTSVHTVRVDQSGRVWASGGPAITMFDPKTAEFKHFDVPATYGNIVGMNGDEWFTSFRADGPIARVTKDGVLTKFNPPTHGKPQRLAIGSDRNRLVHRKAGEQDRELDPSTGAITEIDLPGPEASP